MSEDQMSVDLMDYAAMTQNALRGVIRQALLRAASKEGLPGEHHFYVTFLTRAAGVSVPDDLLAALEGQPTALAMFQILTAQNRFAIVFRVDGAKRPETRARRIEKYVDMLARGETIYPQRRTLADDA